MSAEGLTYSPNSDELSSGAVVGNVQTDNDQEALAEGTRQLVGNIVKVAETDDPVAIKDYLNEVLGHTEGQVPSAERMAAFSFLSAEQRLAIENGLLSSGQRMLDNMASHNAKTRGELDPADRAVKGMNTAVIEAHQQTVGRNFHGRLDSRGAARDHDEFSHTATRQFRAVNEGSEAFKHWSTSVGHEADAFIHEVKKGSDHQRALDEAGTTLGPDHQGEPVDLAHAIDETVKESAAEKLKSIISEAQAGGKLPEEAVLELLTEAAEAPEGTATKTIKELRYFADSQVGPSRINAVKVQELSDESQRLIKNFVGRGREGYQYARSLDEVADLYRRQKRTLDEAASAAKRAMSHATNSLDISDQELKQIQRAVRLANEQKTI